MPQLDVSTYISQIFWLGLCFSCLLAFCLRFSVPQLDRLFQQRWAENEGLIEQADTLIHQTAILQEKIDQRLADARTQTHQKFQEALQQISRDTEQSKIAIHTQFEKQFLDAEQQLQQQYHSSLHHLEEMAESLTPLITEKLSESASLSFQHLPKIGVTSPMNQDTSYVH